MLLRVTVACAVLNPALALGLPRYIGPAFLIGLMAILGVQEPQFMHSRNSDRSVA